MTLFVSGKNVTGHRQPAIKQNKQGVKCQQLPFDRTQFKFYQRDSSGFGSHPRYGSPLLSSMLDNFGPKDLSLWFQNSIS